MFLSIRKHIIICTLLICISSGVFSQTPKIDSLKNLLSQEQVPSKQRELIIKICERHYSLPLDSFLTYINLAQKIAIPGSVEEFRIKNFYCTYLSKAGKVDEALLMIDSLLKEIPADESFLKTRFALLNNRCALLMRSNKPKETIEQGFKLLQAVEENGDTLWMVRTYVLLGWAYMELEKFNDAVIWLNKGIYLPKNENTLQISSVLFSNIASSYNNLNQRDSAFKAIEKALYYSRSDENLSVQANALNIRADMYMKEKNYAAAENDLKEALKVREQIGDELYVIADMGQLSSFYASIGETGKGIETAQKAIELAREKKNLSQLIFVYESLSENYRKANMKDDYAASLLTISGLKDTLYQKNSEEAVAGFEAKYELQKKENIIIQQENKLNRNRYFTIGALIFIGLLSMLIGLIYRNRQLVRLRKMEAELVEQKIRAVEAVKEAEENERKRIAADLHDNLGSFAAAITTNVKNLKEGVMEKEEVTAQLEENAQNMVSQLSDTIWVLKNEHLPLTKLADRFKVWMQRLIKNYPGVKYHYSEEITDDVEFTPVKILHIFLILKECVTNSLKHSKCTDIKINFISNEQLQISIEDNGKGFNNSVASEKSREEFGSGIANIKYRAAESGWSVEWQNATPRGTRVVLTGNTTK